MVKGSIGEWNEGPLGSASPGHHRPEASLTLQSAACQPYL